MYIIKEKVLTLYHTSPKKISSIKKDPMFFTDRLDLAKAWYDNAVDERGKAFSYLFNYDGKILSRKEIQKFCKENDIDYEDFEIELVGNPDDVLSIEGIDKIKRVCDGFRLMDYDPRDSQSDEESILILNTSKLKNQKLMSYEEPKKSKQIEPTVSSSASSIDLDKAEKIILDNWSVESKKTIAKPEIDRYKNKGIDLTYEDHFKPLISRRVHQDYTYKLKDLTPEDFLKIVKKNNLKIVSGKKFGIEDFIPVKW